MTAADLTWLAETWWALPSQGRLGQVCQRGLYSCVHFALAETERLRNGFEYSCSLFQEEYWRNWLFRRRAQREQICEALLDRTRFRLDLNQLMTIFFIGEGLLMGFISWLIAVPAGILIGYLLNE